MKMTDAEKVKDHEYLLAVIEDMTTKLRDTGTLSAKDRTVFLDARIDGGKLTDMHTLLDTLEALLMDRK